MSKHRPEPLLPLARRRLADAVHALADPVPEWINGHCRYTPATYSRLRASLRSRPAGSVRLVPGSRPPCHSGILTLVVEIDTTAATWEPGEKTTLDRLRQVAERDRSPDDVALLDDYTQQIEAWTVQAGDLLADHEPTIPIRLPCPSCGRKHYYRKDSAGDTVRSPTLTVSSAGARCLSCNATWTPEKFDFLAKLLGCPALPV